MPHSDSKIHELCVPFCKIHKSHENFGLKHELHIDPLPNSLQEDLINIGKTKLSLSYIYFLLYVQPSSIHVCYLQRDSIYFEFS